MLLSVVIPAHNEEQNIGACIDELRSVLRDQQHIPYEIIVVDDNSDDGTADVVTSQMDHDASVRLLQRQPPAGFGRAVRDGLTEVRGDAVVIYMGDRSDDAADVVSYYRKLEEGYDCVYGSRFIAGSKVEGYPTTKLILNRIVNKSIQLLFWTRFNDLTNAFKAYRAEVLRDCGPFTACHFNITIEMSLGVLIRRYYIAQIPVNWSGRTWGSSKLSVFKMGRRYLSTLLMLFFQRILISDDLLADRLAKNMNKYNKLDDLSQRLEVVEDHIKGREKRES